MMRSLWMLPFLFGLAFAQLTVPTEVTVDPGAFLSLPVRLTGGADHGEVRVPKGFRLLSNPRFGEGRALVNVLVSPDTLAGEYRIVFDAFRGGKSVVQAVTRVRVRARVVLKLTLPEDRTVVQDTRVRYAVRVQNLGNAVDRVRLEVSTSLPHTLEPTMLVLRPGEVKEAVLELMAEHTRLDAATVRAYSSVDPSYMTHAMVRTRVEAYAGANAMRGPALGYEVRLRLGYEQQTGLDYRVGLGLSGGLSDYARLGTGLRYRNGFSGQAVIYGDRFSLGYRYGGNWQRFEGELEDFYGYVTLSDVFAFGTGYDGPWGRLAFNQRPGLYRLRASRDFGVAPDLTVSPWLGLEAQDLTLLAVVPSGGFSVHYAPLPFAASARVSASPLGVSAGIGLASRRSEPFGYRGEATWDGREMGAKVGLQQRLDLEWQVYEKLGYRGAFSGGVGGRYEPLSLPMNAFGEVGVAHGGFYIAGGSSASYGPVRGRAEFRYVLGEGWPGWSLLGGYSNADWLFSSRLSGADQLKKAGADLRLRLNPWTVTASGSYAFTDATADGQAKVEYALENGGMLGIRADYDGAWRLGVYGELVLRGGFTTPESVVAAFGGRATGHVSGVVFHDENRNGVFDLGEPVVERGVIFTHGAEASVGDGGRYDLELYPSHYALEIRDLPANLGLLRAKDVEFDLTRGERVRVDVPLETVVGVTGFAFYDANANGSHDDGEDAAAYVRVRLRGPKGSREVWTDGQGYFQMGGLVPGEYSIALVPESLKRYQEPAGAVRVLLEPGPLPRVRLAAVPVVRSVKKTIEVGDLDLYAELGARQAPPGAEVPIRVQSDGADHVVAEIDGKVLELEHRAGSWQGYLRVPNDAKNVLLIRVYAKREGKEKTQQLVLSVRPGPLAQLTLTPALVSPGERVRVKARFLARVDGAVLRLGDARFTLHSEEPFAFTGEITAPIAPGPIEVELWAEGRRWAVGRFTVEGQATGQEP